MIAFLRDLVFHDFWLKFLSLILAILIWLTISFSISNPMSVLTANKIEREFSNVPVLVILPAADVRDVRIKPTSIDVTVQGDPRVLRNLTVQSIQAQVNLTGIEFASGLRKSIDVVLPPGLTQTRVFPDTVEVLVPASE